MKHVEKYGKFAQFCKTYLIAVNGLHILNYAINTNSFELKLRIGERKNKDALEWTKLIM